jgi:Zn-dependent alcohol dehydrogenase
MTLSFRAAVQGARLAGAAQIMAVDLNDAKLVMAQDVGATHVVNARVADPVAAVRAITGGRGADCVLEAAGNEALLRLSTEACRVGGEIVWYLRGELKLDGLITPRLGLEDINRGFDDLKAGRGHPVGDRVR